MNNVEKIALPKLLDTTGVSREALKAEILEYEHVAKLCRERATYQTFVAEAYDEAANRLRQLVNKDLPPKTCKYCTNDATKTLVWLKDKYGRPSEIKVLWCGCDLVKALKRFFPYPYTPKESIDYRLEALPIE